MGHFGKIQGLHQIYSLATTALKYGRFLLHFFIEIYCNVLHIVVQYPCKEVSEMLKVKDVAAFFQVSERTVWNWIYSGKIKTVKIGGVLRIPEGEIERLKKGE